MSNHHPELLRVFNMDADIHSIHQSIGRVAFSGSTTMSLPRSQIWTGKHGDFIVIRVGFVNISNRYIRKQVERVPDSSRLFRHDTA